MSNLTPEDIDRIVGMAWEDRTPFDAIERQFGVSESAVIALMRQNMKPTSFKMWRERVQGRATKHEKKSGKLGKFKCNLQRNITLHKISKRK